MIDEYEESPLDTLHVLRELAAAWELLDERQREAATNQFFADRTFVLAGLARYQCQKARLSVNRFLDDVHQIIQEAAFASFTAAMADPSSLDQIRRSWEYWIVGQSANRINALSRVERALGMSGVDAMMKKNDALVRKMREMAASTGVEPTKQDVVDSYNDGVAKRAYPGKEPKATVADFAPPAASTTADDSGGDAVAVQHPGADGPTRLDPGDRLLLPKLVAEHLRQQAAHERSVAEVQEAEHRNKLTELVRFAVEAGASEARIAKLKRDVDEYDARVETKRKAEDHRCGETIEYAMWWLDQFNSENGAPDLPQVEQAHVFGVSVGRLRQLHSTTKDAVAHVFVHRLDIGPAE